MTYPPRTGPSVFRRIPGAGPVADLHQVIEDAYVGGCDECETETFFDDIADMTDAVLEFLRSRGIELGR